MSKSKVGTGPNLAIVSKPRTKGPIPDGDREHVFAEAIRPVKSLSADAFAPCRFASPAFRPKPLDRDAAPNLSTKCRGFFR